MSDILVTSPYRPFTLPNQFKAVFNGYIYCGTVGAADPSVSQVQVYLINESGSKVPVTQPLRTNAGGFLVYNGQPAKFVTESNHSLLVRDSLGLQVWYAPNMAEIDPAAASFLAIEALRRSYAEAGYNLVDGSFEAGGTLVDTNDVLLQERTGKAFSGPAGTVAAGTNPASGGFVDVSGELGTIPCLKNLRTMPGLLQSTVSFYEGFGYGGADYLFDPAISKSLHDGIAVYAPEAIAAWDGTPAGIATLLEWTGAGTGAFVRQSSTPDTIALVDVGAVISKVVSSSVVVNHVNTKLIGHRLLLPREILLTATLTPRNRFIGANRLLNTVWFSGVVDGVVFDKVNYGASLEYCKVKPVSWDPASGATGTGIRLIRPSNVIDVSSERWPEHGCIMHHDMTGQTGPYYSEVRNLITDYNGKHGCVIGTGANAVIVTNHIGRWSGAPSYTATPDDIVLGNYDGLLISSTGDGNPNGAYPVYDPEGVRVIGGDCSYNSRWGYNVVNARTSMIQPSYAELNKKASQQAVGASTRACIIDFPMGTDDDIEVSQTQGEVNPNSIRVRGKLIGSGHRGSDGYRLNMELKGLRNRMTTGSNCIIDLVPDSAGNLHVNGTGFQPKLIIDNPVEFRLGTANTVSVAAGAASTHKIKMLVGGATYYLLAST